MKPFTFLYNGKQFEGELLVETVAVGEIYYVHLQHEEFREAGGPHFLFYREMGIEPEFRYQRSRSGEVRSKNVRHCIIEVLKDL
jgi:hypothetical protein